MVPAEQGQGPEQSQVQAQAQRQKLVLVRVLVLVLVLALVLRLLPLRQRECGFCVPQCGQEQLSSTAKTRRKTSTRRVVRIA